MPIRQMSGQPTVAITDKLNLLIFIRSKTPVYLVMTDQSAPSTASVPTLPSSLFSRFFGAAQPAWSVLQSNCVKADQPQKVFNKGHMCDQIVQGI